MTPNPISICVTSYKSLSFRIDPASDNGSEFLMPDDYAEVVNVRGDRLRDGLTRSCLYMSTFFDMKVEDVIILCGQTPNLEALRNFYASCRVSAEVSPSAQAFALATTSAGTTSLNISNGVKGGNLTISVEEGALKTGVMLASSYLKNSQALSVFLFLPVEKESELIVTGLEIQLSNTANWGISSNYYAKLAIGRADECQKLFSSKNDFLSALSERIYS